MILLKLNNFQITKYRYRYRYLMLKINIMSSKMRVVQNLEKKIKICQTRFRDFQPNQCFIETKSTKYDFE